MTVGTIFNIFSYLPMLEPKKPVCSLGCFNKCNTSRKALLLPIPGLSYFVNCFSINFEEIP
jgi:hypothetical protein